MGISKVPVHRHLSRAVNGGLFCTVYYEVGPGGGYLEIECVGGKGAITYAIWLLSADRKLPDYAAYWGMYLPGFAAVFLLIANYRIQKDQQLVDSMDRLR